MAAMRMRFRNSLNKINVWSRTFSSLKIDKQVKLDVSDEWETAKPFDEMPGPKSFPFIGTAWQFLPVVGLGFDISRFGTYIEIQNKRYGTIWRDNFAGLKIVVSSSPEDAEKVLRDEGRFPERPVLESLVYYRNQRKDILTSHGALLANGEDWWRIRSKIQQPMLRPKNMLLYLPTMGQIANEFIDRIRLIRPENNEMKPDFVNELYKWALESVGAVALNTRLGCLSSDQTADSEAQKMILAVSDTLESVPKLDFGVPIWKYVTTPTLKKLFEAQDVILRTTIKYVENTIESLKGKENNEEDVGILEGLLLQGMPKDDVIVVALDILAAAVDTTSHSMAFLLYLLSRNPDKQEELRKQIHSVIPTKETPVTPDALNQLQYLKACVKESHRLLPAAGGVGRILKEDIVLSGYQIPKGTNISIPTQLISRQEKHFKDPDRYIPERWLKGHPLESKAHPYAVLPFGHGVRMCVGRRLAEIEMWQLTIKLLQNFRVEYHHDDIGLTFRLVNAPDQPLRFKFIDLN